MHFDEYQQRAGATDQNPRPEDAANEASRNPRRHEVIPLLGLVDELGGLLTEHENLLHDGAT